MTAAPDRSSPFRLDGQSVLVTGAGGGLGRAMVAVFRAAGATVSGADRETGMLDGLGLAESHVFDLADAKAAAAAAERLLAGRGAPDILVSNAGYTRAEVLDQVDGAVWDSELAINLTGAFNFVAPLVEAMAGRGRGTVLFISSVNGLAYYGNPAYSAAKAGLIAYARAIAMERGAAGVRCNVICPGSVRTQAWDHRFERDPAIAGQVLPHYPLGRMVTPDEVANTALFLVSPAASGITGAVLPVDGGLTAGNLRFVNDVIAGGR